MDTFTVPKPIKIEDDEDDDLIIYGCAIKTPADVVKDWDIEIKRKVLKYMKHENEKFLDDLMSDYVRLLKEKTDLFEEKTLFKTKILKHVKFFHSYYLQMDFMETSSYLENMEDILTVYCNLELDIVRHLKKRDFNSKYDFKQSVKGTCRKICYVLKTYLLDKEEHIHHVLIKMNNVSNTPTCKSVMNSIYMRFLMELPPRSLTDEAFCRSYILFLRWKEIRESEEHSAMDQVMYFRYKQTPESAEKNKILKYVLTPSNQSAIDAVSQLLDSSHWSATAYFKYIKNQKCIENEPNCINLDMRDEDVIGISDEDDFNKTLSEVVSSFSTKLLEDSNNQTVSNHNKESTESDCITLDDNSYIDISSDISDSEGPVPVCVIDDELDDDIDEIVFIECKAKQHRKRHRNKEKEPKLPVPIPLTSFLDSIPDVLCSSKEKRNTHAIPLTNTTSEIQKEAISSIPEVCTSVRTDSVSGSKELTCVTVPKEKTNNTSEKLCVSVNSVSVETTEKNSVNGLNKTCSEDLTVFDKTIPKTTNSSSVSVDKCCQQKDIPNSSEIKVSDASTVVNISDFVSANSKTNDCKQTLSSPKTDLVEYICKKCTDTCSNSESKSVNLKTVEIQTEEDSDLKNCYYYGIVTPPSDPQIQIVQEFSDEISTDENIGNTDRELNDGVTDYIEQQSEELTKEDKVCSGANFNNVEKQDNSVVYPYITSVFNINTEIVFTKDFAVSEENVTKNNKNDNCIEEEHVESNIQNSPNTTDNSTDTSLLDEASHVSEKSHLKNVNNLEKETVNMNTNMEEAHCETVEVVSTDSMQASKSCDQNVVEDECDGLIQEDKEEIINKETEIVDAPVYADLQTVETPFENAQEVVYLHSDKSNIVETAFTMAENEVETNENEVETNEDEILDNSFEIEEQIISVQPDEMLNDIDVREVVVEDCSGLVFDSSGVCQNVYYLIDGQLVACNNASETNENVTSATKKDTEIVKGESEEATKLVDSTKTLPPTETSDMHLENTKNKTDVKETLSKPEDLSLNKVQATIKLNEQINGIRLSQLPVENKFNTESENGSNSKIMYTSTETIKAVSLSSFNEFENALNKEKDLDDFREVLSSPVTRINGISSNHEFFNSNSASDFNFDKPEPSTSKAPSTSSERSRSSSPLGSPEYDPMNDFKEYFKHRVKSKLSENNITNSVPVRVDNRRLQGILNKNKNNTVDVTSSNSVQMQNGDIHKRQLKRKSQTENNSQSKRRVKFHPLVSSYNYPIMTLARKSVKCIPTLHDDPKLVSLVPTIKLTKYTEEELLKQEEVRRERARHKQKQKQLIDDLLKKRRTMTSHILERVIFDKSNENDVKVYKVQSPTLRPSPLEMNSHGTVPTSLSHNSSGTHQQWENNRFRLNFSNGSKSSTSPPIIKRGRGRPRKNSSPGAPGQSGAPTVKRKTTTSVSAPKLATTISDVNSILYSSKPFRYEKT